VFPLPPPPPPQMFCFAGHGGKHPLVQKNNLSLYIQKTQNVLYNSKLLLKKKKRMMRKATIHILHANFFRERGLQADSHIACCAHAIHHAAKGFRMCLSYLIYKVQPCMIHTCHDMPTLHPCHALTMPFFSRPCHSMAIERRPVGYLPAFVFFWLPCRVPRRLLSEAYQSSSQ